MFLSHTDYVETGDTLKGKFGAEGDSFRKILELSSLALAFSFKETFKDLYKLYIIKIFCSQRDFCVTKKLKNNTKYF